MAIDWTTFALEVVNFLVLVWLLKRFLYQPVLEVLVQRRAGVARTLEEAGVRQAVREQLGYLLPNERRVPLLELPNASVSLPARWPYTLVASIVALRETQRDGVQQGNLDTYDPLRP